MLEGVSDEEITELNIPTGVPRLYELDASLHPSAPNTSATPPRSLLPRKAVANQAKAKK